MPVRIQILNNSHSQQIIDLILHIQQNEFNIPITIKDQPDLLDIEDFYIRGGGNFWGAFIDEELVGTIALIKYDNAEGAIRKMFVKEAFRGKEHNIAQQLLEGLVEYAKQHLIHRLYLGTVTVLKAAMRFYERNQFQQIEKYMLPAKFPLMRADNVFYSLDLNPGKTNVINEIGVLALSTRLQRLSEQLRKDGAAIYELFGIDFEPKWFPVIYTLHRKKMLSVVELANEIGYTHPSTITLLKELEKLGLIKSKKDRQDERKRLILLTTKGETLVANMGPVWNVIGTALAEIANNENNLLKAIEEAEEKIAGQSFLQRAMQIKNAGRLFDDDDDDDDM